MKYSVSSRLVVCMLFALSSSWAARLESGSSFTLLKEEIQTDDLYYAGNALRVDGRVEGSISAMCQSAAISGFVTKNVFLCCQTVDLSGAVQGDLLALCLSMHLGGPVSGAVRCAAGVVSVDSRVGKDLLVVCRDLTLGRNAEIAGDVLVACATLNINGTVHGDVRAAASEVIVSGIIDGDLIAQVGTRLVLTKDARIFGSLIYKSDFEQDLGNRDAVFGEIKYVRRLPRPTGVTEAAGGRRGWFLLRMPPFSLIWVISALVAGLILTAVARMMLGRVFDAYGLQFGRRLGVGALVMLALPAVLIISLVLVVTIPLGIVGLLFYLFLLYLARILAGMFCGRMLFRLFGGAGASLWLTAPVGILLLYALSAVPYIGGMVWLFSLAVGFGVLVQLSVEIRRT